MLKSKALTDRVMAELRRREALSPISKIDAREISTALCLDDVTFDTAISHLTSLEKVGVIRGSIYLREAD